MRPHITQGRNATVSGHGGPLSQAAAGAASPVRRPYTGPRLACLGEIDSWLEVLGPAQANYNGVGAGP